jgi:hypothetical protein
LEKPSPTIAAHFDVKIAPCEQVEVRKECSKNGNKAFLSNDVTAGTNICHALVLIAQYLPILTLHI